MLAGHYAAAFAGKAAQPKVPLWLLFVAAQLVDLVWGLLVLVGVERASLDYAQPSNPMVAEYMPYTHSLLGTAVAATLAGFLAWKVWASRRGAIVVALVVLSHWFLDLLVHRPDLTLAGSEPKLGFELWNYPLIAQSLELGLLLLSLMLLRSLARPTAQQARVVWILFGSLVFVQFYAIFAPPPPNVPQMAASLLLVWAALPGLAAWLESRRT